MNDRLTARNHAGLAYLVNVKPNEQEVESPHKNTLKCILDCFERLAQYEDTGLTPGDVKDLQALCKENGLAKYVDVIVEAKRQMARDNEISIERDEHIESLQADLARVTAERDAAVADLHDEMVCGVCIHSENDTDVPPCDECFYERSKFVWRGVKGEQE